MELVFKCYHASACFVKHACVLLSTIMHCSTATDVPGDLCATRLVQSGRAPRKGRQLHAQRHHYCTRAPLTPRAGFRYTGILFGITNASSSFAGTLSTYTTGRILDATESWAAVFVIIAAVYTASAGVYLAWASADNQFDDLEPAGGSQAAIPKGPWR